MTHHTTDRYPRPVHTPPAIDVYAVGWLKAGQSAWRFLTLPELAGRRGNAWKFLRQQWLYCVRQARRRNWRAVKNQFNGYLAEHRTRGTRCGHGWTRRRALRDLYRHLAEVTAR